MKLQRDTGAWLAAFKYLPMCLHVELDHSYWPIACVTKDILSGNACVLVMLLACNWAFLFNRTWHFKPKGRKIPRTERVEVCNYLILSVPAFVLLMWSPCSNPFSMHMCMPECPQSNVASNWFLFSSNISSIGSLLCFHSKSSNSTKLDRKEVFCWCSKNFIQGFMRAGGRGRRE